VRGLSQRAIQPSDARRNLHRYCMAVLRTNFESLPTRAHRLGTCTRSGRHRERGRGNGKTLSVRSQSGESLSRTYSRQLKSVSETIERTREFGKRAVGGPFHSWPPRGSAVPRECFKRRARLPSHPRGHQKPATSTTLNSSGAVKGKRGRQNAICCGTADRRAKFKLLPLS